MRKHGKRLKKERGRGEAEAMRGKDKNEETEEFVCIDEQERASHTEDDTEEGEKPLER